MKKLSGKAKLRQIRTQKRRERKAKKRKLIKRGIVRRAKVNRRVRLPDKLSGDKTLSLPSILDLFENRQETIEAISELQRILIKSSYKNVTIDMSKIAKIAPEAMLYLLAEIERCSNYMHGKNVVGNYPSDPEVCTILSESGYFEYFQAAPPKFTPSKRVYLKVRSGNLTQGQVVDELLQTFEKQVNLRDGPRRLLYSAITECMDNVKQHAYRKKMKTPYLLGNWWILGSCDTNTGELSFCLLDQGMGIPGTLREKWADKLKTFFFSDADLITEAVHHGRSRLKDVRRGNGLPSLLRFVENAPEGRLAIFSKSANNCYFRNGPEKVTNDGVQLEGTLISWLLKPVADASLYGEQNKTAEKPNGL